MKPFEGLDSTAIRTMDTILLLLTATRKDSHLVLLGKQVFEYRLVRYLNDLNLVLKDTRVLSHTRQKYREFLMDSLSDYNRYCGATDSSNYVRIGRMFLHNDLGCVQSLTKPLNDMINLQPSTRQILPTLRIPPAYKYKSTNPFVIRSTVQSVAPYLVDHAVVFNKVIRSQLKAQNLPPVSNEVYSALMEVYDYEGEILLNILLKKFVYSDAGFITNSNIQRLLKNQRQLKTIVAGQNKLLGRLLSLNAYRASLLAIPPSQNHLVGATNRLVASLYREKRQSLIDWVPGLLAFYKKSRRGDFLLLEEDALADMRRLHEGPVRPPW